MPKISVCIPVYNCEQYVSQAIDSVLTQTYTDFELLILDNKSTDNTLNIVKKYTDTRIRIIENDVNIGFEANWNKCLKEAKCEYIKLLCADDILLPMCLEKQIEVFENEKNKHKNILIVASGRYVIDANSKILMKRYWHFRGDTFVNGIKMVKKSIRFGTNIIGEPGAVLFKKEILNKTGGFDGTFLYVIDFSLWVKILKYGNIYLIKDPYFLFRISNVSESVKIMNSHAKNFRDFIVSLKIDKGYKIFLWDMICGVFMAYMNSILRKIFYKFIKLK
jgi:glycosyltransferase involved in cell wall biosynthesis